MTTTEDYTADGQAWDKLVLDTVPGAHYLQSSAWAAAKEQFYWPATRYLARLKQGPLPIQAFSRNVPGMGRVHYIPELVGVTAKNLPDLTSALRQRYPKGLALKMELYQPSSEELIAAFEANGWKRAKSVQHRTTVLVDLRGSEEEVFSRIKSRARYEIRAAQRHGVTVEKVDLTQANLDIMADLIDVTAKRSGGFFRSRAYLNSYWHAFAEHGQASLYFAKHDGDILAGAFVITFGNIAWYKDGGSVRQKSNLLAPRLIHWEIMRDLIRQGVHTYDLSGIPAPDQRDTSPLKGLFTFKTAYANDVARLMPAMELPLGRGYALWPKAERQLLRVYNTLRHDFWY